MSRVWNVLNILHILSEGCLGVEWVVLEEVEVGEQLLNLVLYGCSAQCPFEPCLHRGLMQARWVIMAAGALQMAQGYCSLATRQTVVTSYVTANKVKVAMTSS